MRRSILVGLAVAAVLGMLASQTLADHKHEDRGRSAKARLSGYEEVPAISTAGSGWFRASLNEAGSSMSYELHYTGLESTASAAHIHFGQPGVSGGVLAWLCGGGGKPACPATSGTVSGTIVAADVMAIAAQGIEAGNLTEAMRAIRARVAYVNVHTSGFPGGEIRGQIK